MTLRFDEITSPPSQSLSNMSSSSNKPVASVIRPGKAPQGPPGWEERRIEKQSADAAEQERKNHRRENSSGVQGMKDNLHRIGEKMHLVEPKDPAQRTAAQLQDASTMPERAPTDT